MASDALALGTPSPGAAREPAVETAIASKEEPMS